MRPILFRLPALLSIGLRLTRLESENLQLRERLGKHEMVWASPIMRQLMGQVERVAASQSRVCILGETGTGKELVARTLHMKSPRRDGPFVTLNCAAVPAELIESELFGHEKGAFTGASSRQPGKFEQAHQGTFFLDEIGDMPLARQAKLLRVLEEGEIERIGGQKPIAVNVRVIAATHRDLAELIRTGSFRQDLFHRVYVFPLSLPPLRERLEDIPVLVEHFSNQVARLNGWKPKTFHPAAIQALQQYHWPGNVRELRNIVERLFLLCDAEVDRAAVSMALPAPTSRAEGLPAAQGPLAERLKHFERELIQAELKRHNYHRTQTAQALSLERSHLYKKCQQLEIDLKNQKLSE